MKALNVNIPDMEKKILFNSSIVTLFFNFLSGHFDKIPKDMMKEIMQLVLRDSK
jgi:hypothetical protein